MNLSVGIQILSQTLEGQGEILNTVEENVRQAEGSVIQAVKSLNTSRSLRDRIGNKKFIASFISGFVILLLLIVIMSLSKQDGGDGVRGGEQGRGKLGNEGDDLPVCQSPEDTNCVPD